MRSSVVRAHAKGWHVGLDEEDGSADLVVEDGWHFIFGGDAVDKGSSRSTERMYRASRTERHIDACNCWSTVTGAFRSSD